MYIAYIFCFKIWHDYMKIYCKLSKVEEKKILKSTFHCQLTREDAPNMYGNFYGNISVGYHRVYVQS